MASQLNFLNELLNKNNFTLGTSSPLYGGKNLPSTRVVRPNVINQISGSSPNLLTTGNKLVNPANEKILDTLIDKPININMSPKGTYNIKLNNMDKVLRNAKTTSRAVARSGKAVSKLAGKAAPAVGAGLSVLDVANNYRISNDMKKYNEYHPGTFSEDDINYYINKARTIEAGLGLGAGIGGVAGAGVFSIPGALVGSGTGALVSGLGYDLLKGMGRELTPEQKLELKQRADGTYNVGSKNTSQPNKSGSKATGSSQPNVTYGINPNGRIVNANGVNIDMGQVADDLTGVDVQGNINNQNINSEALDKLLQLYNQQQEYMRPYQQGLENYINNYENLQRQAYNNQRANAALAGLSGNPYYAKLNYNPAEIEATKLDLINKLAQSQQGTLSGANRLVGNASILQQAGMPAEAALADEDLLKIATAYLGKQQANEIKDRYNDVLLQKAKMNNATKLQIAQLANSRALAIAQGNWNNRKEIAYQNYLGRLGSSLIGGLSYGANPMDTYSAYGALTGRKIQPQQVIQQSKDRTTGQIIDPAAEFGKVK